MIGCGEAGYGVWSMTGYGERDASDSRYIVQDTAFTAFMGTARL